MRYRYVFTGVGSLLVVMVLLLSDPDGGLVKNLPFGGGTLGVLINLVISILFIALLHTARKGLVDYIDLETFFKKALQTSEGAGLAIIGVGLIMVSIAMAIMAATK